jgi:predicted thioesterase
MKPGLQVGELCEIIAKVDEQAKANLLGGPVHPLYGTAGMIAHMEWAARQHILPYLEEDEEGVGYHVDVTHLKPAPLGVKVKILSRVTDIQPRRVTSQVEAWWGDTKLGEGTFTQAIASREKLYACIARHVEVFEQTPAELRDAKRQTSFSLRILRWEYDISACTRYDEWLVGHAKINSVVHEGAFLLRYEVEEWQHACEALVAKTQSEYQSDFLEPMLVVQMHRDANDEIHITIQLKAERTESVQLVLSAEQVKLFAAGLAKQLEDFPSQL